MTQTANDPAAIAVAPGHGPIRSDEDTKMNSQTNITAEHPWEAARQHAKALSDTLSLCNDGDWYAHVFPSNRQYRICFAVTPDADQVEESPLDVVNRLAWELAHALNDYMDGRFQARIYPSDQAGYAVMFTVTNAAERRKS